MLNLNKIGKPLARIDKGKYAGMVVSVSDGTATDNTDENLIKEFKRLAISNESKFQLIPDTTIERQILYITGPSGSGKSTFTRRYIEELKKKKKDMPVYLFSALTEDESLDSVEPLRITLDESIYEDPITLEDLKESVCIFDDCDCLSDRKIREAVYKILNQLLELARHTKTYVIVTNHLATNARDTRRILNEAHIFVYFPASASGRIKYFLSEYVGLDKKTILYLKKQPTRWACIFKHYPSIYMIEREIGLLSALNDD